MQTSAWVFISTKRKGSDSLLYSGTLLPFNATEWSYKYGRDKGAPPLIPGRLKLGISLVRIRYLLPLCFNGVVFEGRSGSQFILPMPTTRSLVHGVPLAAWNTNVMQHASRRVVTEDSSAIHRRPFDHLMALNGFNASSAAADLPRFEDRGMGASGERGLTHLGDPRGVLRKSHPHSCPNPKYPTDISSRPRIFTLPSAQFHLEKII